MPRTIACSETEVIEDLMEVNFPELDDEIVNGPRGLVPVALTQIVDLRQASITDARQGDALGRAAGLLDKARDLCRPLLFRTADTLGGQHRLAQARRVTFTAAARLLVQAHAIMQEAGLVLRITTGKVRDMEGGGYRRAVALDAVSARATTPDGLEGDATQTTRSRGTPAAPEARADTARAAALIAAGYLARHPDTADAMPAIIREISCALQSCGTLPNDVDDVPRFAGRLAKAMPSAPIHVTRHARVRRRALQRKVPAGA